MRCIRIAMKSSYKKAVRHLRVIRMVERRQGLASNAFAVILMTASTSVPASETGVFQPPGLDGYAFVEEKSLDKDEKPDGIRETRLEIYQSRSGEKIGKYVTGGKTWAWAVAPNRKNVCHYPDNYAIRDSDGDGVFDERYRYCNEDFWLPAFLTGSAPPPGTIKER